MDGSGQDELGDTLGVSDLVDAYFDAARFRDAVPELREYHAKRLSILEHLLSFDIAAAVHGARERMAIAGGNERVVRRDIEQVGNIARRCLELSASTPFDVYLEGAPGPFERGLRDAYQPKLAHAVAEYHDTLRDLFARIVATLDPGVLHRRVLKKRLIEMGLPAEAPDPDDFW